MVDRLIQLMQSSALISPQMNNITIERVLDVRHGTIEDLNIQGLVAGTRYKMGSQKQAASRAIAIA